MAPATDTRNEAGGVAYKMTDRAALAQYAITGSLTPTFYATAETQLKEVLRLARANDIEFVAKTAIYCRERGYMKDMPALLITYLVTHPEGGALVEQRGLFNRVINNGRMLRNFAQMMRSGTFGRKALESARIKRLVTNWLAVRRPEQIWRQSIGQNPTMGDVLRLVHPRPASSAHDALYGYLLGRITPTDEKFAALPEVIRVYEMFRQNAANCTEPPRGAPHEFLVDLPLLPSAWELIAERMTWQQTRMNLNTLLRHKVFGNACMVEMIARRLRDPEEIARAHVFPYQLMIAHQTISGNAEMPMAIKVAVQDALDLSLANIPQMPGKVYVCPDTSGSMSSPVTGDRGRGATTKVNCIDVAALVAAAILRAHPDAGVLPFDTRVHNKEYLNPRDSIATNTRKLASYGGGGTDCSLPLRELNDRGARGDLVVYISDYESWADSPARAGWGNRGSAMAQAWEVFKQRNPNAKLVLIDLTPSSTMQVKDAKRSDILHVGGFSDHVFDVMASFARGDAGAEHWVRLIDQTPLDAEVGAGA